MIRLYRGATQKIPQVIFLREFSGFRKIIEIPACALIENQKRKDD
jgi:hypothetical protein